MLGLQNWWNLRQAGRQWPNYLAKRGGTYRKFLKNANRDSKHTTVSSSTQRTYHPEKNSRYSKKNSIYQTWASPKFVCSGQCVLTERFEASIIFTNIYFGGYGYQKMTGRLILFPCIRFACSCQQTLPQLFACLFFVESRRHKYPFPKSIVC